MINNKGLWWSQLSSDAQLLQSESVRERQLLATRRRLRVPVSCRLRRLSLRGLPEAVHRQSVPEQRPVRRERRRWIQL